MKLYVFRAAQVGLSKIPGMRATELSGSNVTYETEALMSQNVQSELRLEDGGKGQAV
jgi:hypothetical protein